MLTIKKICNLLFSDAKRFEYLSRHGFYKWMKDEKYLKKKYYLSTGKKLDLDNPRTYNEKLQWLKLNDRKNIYTRIVDKYEVKDYVKNAIGAEYIIPTLGVYNRFNDINFKELPNKFVIKCTHDSGGLVVVRDKTKMDVRACRKTINKSLRRNYYYYGREWPYKNVKPRILIEEYIDVNKGERSLGNKKAITVNELQKENGLLDYKFMCFNGVVKCLFLDIGVIGKGTRHSENYYRNVYDRDFNLLPFLETRENYPREIIQPKNYKKMVEVAEKLSKNIPHVRVDLYNVDGEILFGEMTFFHGSGLSNRFYPDEWDKKLGDMIDLDLVTKNER